MLGSLFPKLEVAELAKIPQLIEHYYEHRQQEGTQFTFLDFLQMHYTAEHGKANCHHNLPFFHISSGLSFILSDFYLALPGPALYGVSRKVNFGYTDHYSFQSVSHLLQPPRVSSSLA